MSEEQARQGRRSGLMSTGRAEAFSDGVFAIAITLLILEIRLPGATAGLTDRGLRDELLGLWPSYLAYTISFLLIGMVWINHHRMFRHIERVDGTLLGLNVLLLMDVAFLPFSTDVLAQSLRDTSAEHTAAVFYGLVLAVGGVFYSGVWWYAASGHRLLGEHITPREARALGIRWSIGPVLYLVAALIGLLSAAASLGCYVLLLIFYFFDMRPRRVPERDA
ncbi:MAG TPA: TMEM175 family protein [Pseudonocardiaceae bacterium]|nr:TMEM175 family protein [Pseudonocardiaceae bacterium]